MATRHNDKPSPAYLAAFKALKALPLGERGNAFADAEADDLKAAMSERLGKETTGRKSWRRLLGKQGEPGDEMPGDDHVELWVKDGELTYVSQPYGLTLDKLKKIVSLCDEHGLNVTIGGGSWYYPGSTIVVTYTKA